MEQFNQTVIHPLGLLFLVLAALAMFSVKREYALLPLLVLLVFVSTTQRFEILGADFTLTRVLLVVGLIRVIARGELFVVKINIFDVVVVGWFTATFVARFLLHGESILAYQMGKGIDILGAYIVVRALVRNVEDLRRLAKAVVILAVVSVPFFFIELFSTRNLFSIFGGVPEITSSRNSTGALRAQGAFPHPILAGCFWASILPFAWAQVKDRKYILGIAGVLAVAFIVIATSSSTPLISLFVAVPVILFYRYRQFTGLAVIAFLVLLAILDLMMNGPIWALAAKVNVIGGSTGWHRYYLIDEAVNRFSEWWLIGTASTAHWGWGLWDVTNGFVAAAVQGGLVGLVLYNLMSYGAPLVIFLCLNRAKTIGERLVLWALFASLLIDIVSLQGASYWGQPETLFILKLAASGSLLQHYFFSVTGMEVSFRPGSFSLSYYKHVLGNSLMKKPF